MKACLLFFFTGYQKSSAVGIRVTWQFCHSNQSASSVPPGVKPFSEADLRAAIDLWKALIPLKNIRDQLKMSERGSCRRTPTPTTCRRWMRTSPGCGSSNWSTARFCGTWRRECLTGCGRLSRGVETLPTSSLYVSPWCSLEKTGKKIFFRFINSVCFCNRHQIFLYTVPFTMPDYNHPL